ncbi:SurA N-terminal domain-containing protein [Ahrensia marina]|uniref:peptidylprolyl isomerase n=1 Tax=Ahrensia marina TaxID=1514904 RepID=UPI0035D0BF4B
MLTALRRGASTTLAKVFLIIVSIAVVAGLGFGGFIGNIGQRTVLAVGDLEISAETFQIALQRQLNRLSQQLGTNLTLEQASLFGLDRQLLGQLASEAALDSEADRLNIGVSDYRLAERIANDPIFLQTGGFNRQFFQQVLRSYGITEDDFVADTRSFAARQQLAQGLVGGMQPADAMLEVANTYANELRVVSFLTLDDTSLGDRPAATEEDLRAFFNDRTGDYRAPEYRSIVYMALSETDLADPSAVSATDVQAAYEAEREELTSAGERDITQLLFQDSAQANEAQARLEAGEAVADLQADESFDFTATELGAVQRTAILDQAAGDAAFSLDAAGPTGVVDGRFGSIIMVVNEVIEDSVTPLEDVEDRLRQELANAAARDEIFSLFDAIEDARAGGDPLDQIAPRFDLELVTVDALDANGFGRDDEPVDLPETNSLIADTFESDVGLENDALDTTGGGFVWFEVTGVEEARDLTFEEAQDRVQSDWEDQQLDEMLRERAGELVSELERGRSLQTLSIALDLPVTITEPFTRGEAPDEMGGPATVAAFEGGEAHFGDVEGPPNADGETTTRLVFVVDDVTRPAFFETAADVQELAEQLAPALEDTVLTQYVQALQNSLGVRVNQALVAELTGGGSHSGM